MDQDIIVPGDDSQKATFTQDVLRLYALLLRHKLFIFLFVLIATAISIVMVLRMPNWYSSSVNLVPPRSSSSLMDNISSGISSTLKDFGLQKLGGSKGGEGYSYIVILQSRRLQDTLIKMFNLAEEYEIPLTKMDELREAFSDNITFSSEKEGNYIVTVTDKDKNKAALMANSTVGIANGIANEMTRQEASVNRAYLEQRMNNTRMSLQQATDSLRVFSKQYRIFSPLDQARAASMALAEAKAEIFRQATIVDITERTYGSQDPITVAQKAILDSLRRQIVSAENEPGFMGNFPLNEGTDVSLRYMRLMTDVEIYSKVKAFLTPMLEQAKLDEFRNAPNMYVLDPAVPADKKSRPKRSVVVAGTAVGSFVFAMIFVVGWDRYRLIRNRYPEIFQKKAHKSTPS